MDNLDDLLLRVRRKGTSGPDAQRYEAELSTEAGRRYDAEEVLLSDYRDPQSSDPKAIAAHGLDLFNRLFVGRLAVAFQQAWAAAEARGHQLRLRLALDPNAPLLHAIPWELMHFDDSGGLSPPHPLAIDARVALSRYIELAEFDEGEPVAHRPIRMLVVISAPSDLATWSLAPIDKAAESRDLKTRFSPIANSGQFQADFLERASEAALHDALRDGGLAGKQPRGYDLLLYYGHALHHPTEGSRLVLEHPASQQVRLYDGDELVGVLATLPDSHRPVMVTLVACNSAAIAGTTTLNSLAARLVLAGNIPAVLAMQRLVEVALARAFTYHLSEHLLRDGLIDMAVNAARRRVFQPDSVSWTTPVLYMRHRDGRLFTPNAQLDYVEHTLRDPDIVRWSGPEFIDLGVLTIAPGQDWNLLRYRPEDAPATVDVLEALTQALSLTPTRGSQRAGARQQTRHTNLIALIGPPHSGQTTVLRRLAHDLADQMTRDLTGAPGLLISLAGYEQQRGGTRLERQIIEMARGFSQALADTLTDLFRPRSSISAKTQRPHFVFLLDDLDSLPEKTRAEVARELSALAERLGEQQFVITSSQETYPGHLLPTAQVLVIQPLSERRIERYLRARDRKQAQRLLQQIRDNRLLTLASDPSLLTMIYERLAPDPLARVTRNQLVQEYLDRRLSFVVPRFTLGDAARDSLVSLAWYSRLNHLEQIPLGDMFRVLGSVRRERDYSLEELYGLLVEARLLTSVGQYATRFVNPALHAYCAAVALANLPEGRSRLADIITLCNNPERLNWWEDVIYFYAGLVPDPTPLFENLAAAIRAGGSAHVLVATRCLEAMPPEHDKLLPATLRDELVDASMLRLRASREPNPERREQIAAALGRLSYPQVRHELRRILVDKVRETSSGPRYEYTNVRIAAARALRTIYAGAQSQLRRTTARAANTLVLSGYSDQANLGSAGEPAGGTATSMGQIRNDQMLVRLMRVHQKGVQGRDEFLDLLRNSPHAPERALAAFAIGDMADGEQRRMLDARQLLRVIVSPDDDGSEPISDDWEDTMWAAADALTLFEPGQVIPLLNILVRRPRPLSDSASQQLAYIAGRVRATSKDVVDWLIKLLITNPNQSVKAKALQSLAWMGSSLPDQKLRLSDGRPGPTLKQLVQAIAIGHTIRDLQPGPFAIAVGRGDNDGTPTYLQRKAIEALAWIGDHETLEKLGPQAQRWPLELREYWYQSAATIRSRIGTEGGVKRDK